MPSYLLPYIRLCQSPLAWAHWRRLEVVHTRCLVKIIIIMEVAGLCALIAAIAIPTNVVEHPRNNPIVPSRRASPIVPFSGWVSRV